MIAIVATSSPSSIAILDQIVKPPTADRQLNVLSFLWPSKIFFAKRYVTVV